MSPDGLTYMANQIGRFFQSQGHDRAVPGIAEHIRNFWDPRMRKAIFAHLEAGGAGLDPPGARCDRSVEEGLGRRPGNSSSRERRNPYRVALSREQDG